MNERIVRRYPVTPDRAGERLDVIATALLCDYSREQVKRWIRAGELTVDGAHLAASARLHGDEHLQLDAALRVREDWQTPQRVPFATIHEDASLLVIDKPPGVVVHPGAGTTDGTLVNGLLAQFPELATVPRAGIVHRLDKDTSGLMLIARTLSVHARLVRMIAAREVGRRYLVLVHGAVAAPFVVDAPIGRDPRLRTSMAVVAAGRPAHTRFRPIAQARGMTLLEAQLTTGRTHQIRVHLAHAGYPVVGDPRYGRHVAPRRMGKRGGGRVGAVVSAPVEAALGAPADSADRDPLGARLAAQEQPRVSRESIARQALHAWRLEVTHPVSGAVLVWSAPPPADFAALLAELGIVVPQRGAE